MPLSAHHEVQRTNCILGLGTFEEVFQCFTKFPQDAPIRLVYKSSYCLAYSASSFCFWLRLITPVCCCGLDRIWYSLFIWELETDGLVNTVEVELDAVSGKTTNGDDGTEICLDMVSDDEQFITSAGWKEGGVWVLNCCSAKCLENIVWPDWLVNVLPTVPLWLVGLACSSTKPFNVLNPKHISFSLEKEKNVVFAHNRRIVSYHSIIIEYY